MRTHQEKTIRENYRDWTARPSKCFEAITYLLKLVSIQREALQQIDGTAYAGLTAQMSEPAALKSISIHARDALAR